MAETQPMMLQALCYTATDFRLQLASMVCGEGVAGLFDGSLLVTTGGSGLDLFVAQGAAFIDSDVADEGIYSVYNDATVTLTATAADATNPRIDQVIATVNDSQIVGTDNDWVLSVLAGTPTVGATLSNLNGAAALPDRSIRLAYVLVPATFAGPFVDATHILDARNTYERCGGVPYVSLEAAATTSLTNATYVQPTLGTVLHIDRDYFSVSGATVTVLQPGLYDFTGFGGVAGIGTAGTHRIGQILRNNTNLPNVAPDGILVSDDRDGAVSTVWLTPHREAYALSANDTIKFALRQDTGGAVNSAHTPASFAVSSLMVRKVG